MPSLASAAATAFTDAVRYSAEREVSQLGALVAAAKEGERKGDYLPHAVLADYLEENPQHVSRESWGVLGRLREGPGDRRPHVFVDGEGRVGATNYHAAAERLHSPAFRRDSGLSVRRYFPAGIDVEGEWGPHAVLLNDPHSPHASPMIEFDTTEAFQHFLETGDHSRGRRVEHEWDG